MSLWLTKKNCHQKKKKEMSVLKRFVVFYSSMRITMGIAKWEKKYRAFVKKE